MNVSGISQQFCVRWNSHLGSLGAAFPQLLAGQRFVDVTLACEGHQVHCHRLVLAACSTYFESLLGENPCKHPIIILPRDVKLWEVQALVDFMYKGEVNVSQAGLPDLLKCAETLQIRGLCGSDAVLNLNQINSTTERLTALSNLTGSLGNQSPSSLLYTYGNNVSSTKAANTGSNTNTNKIGNSVSTTNANNSTNAIQQTNAKGNQTIHKSGFSETGKNTVTTTKNNARNSNQSATSKVSPDETRKTNNIRLKGTFESDDIGITNSKKGSVSPNESVKSFTIRGDEMDESDAKIDDDDEDLDDDAGTKQQGENDQQEVVTVHLDNDHPVASKSLLNTPNSSPIQQQPESTATVPGLDIDIIEIIDNNNSDSTNFVAPASNNTGFIRVKSLENLFENYKHHENGNFSHQHSYKNKRKSIGISRYASKSGDGMSSPISPVSIEPDFFFDENSKMKIGNEILQLNELEALGNDTENIDEFDTNYLNIENDIEGNCSATQRYTKDSKYIELSAMDDDHHSNENCHLLPRSLKFNRDSMTIYVKNSSKASATQPRKRKRLTSTPNMANMTNMTNLANISKSSNSDDQFESIVCSPNFEPISYMSNDDEEEVDMLAQSYDDAELNSSNDLLTEAMSPINDNNLIIDDDDDDDDDDDIESDDVGQNQRSQQNQCPLPKLIPCQKRKIQQLPQNCSKKGEKNRSAKLNTDFEFSDTNSPGLLLMKMSANRMRPSNNLNASSYNHVVRRRNVSRLLKPKPDTLDDRKQFMPLPSAVVLRNPRGNQPRTYNTDALYAALMDVKAGESIYRASQLHKVPRKTLRNWMKRWDIKSAYPMPYQLRQAAEKKKNERVHEKYRCEKDYFAMANVTCEYDTSTGAGGSGEDGDISLNLSGGAGSNGEPNRRIRRSETLLRQAAECVSRGQTFQTVSDMFNIPISTIRFFMARKGILPRRKRGRASVVPIIGEHERSGYPVSDNNFANIAVRNLSNTERGNRSDSPINEPPFHFANFKLPDFKQELI